MYHILCKTIHRHIDYCLKNGFAMQNNIRLFHSRKIRRLQNCYANENNSTHIPPPTAHSETRLFEKHAHLPEQA